MERFVVCCCLLLCLSLRLVGQSVALPDSLRRDRARTSRRRRPRSQSLSPWVSYVPAGRRACTSRERYSGGLWEHPVSWWISGERLMELFVAARPRFPRVLRVHDWEIGGRARGCLLAIADEKGNGGTGATEDRTRRWPTRAKPIPQQRTSSSRPRGQCITLTRRYIPTRRVQPSPCLELAYRLAVSASSR